MGTTKKAAFEEDLYAAAEVFKALGHPARLHIRNLLSDQKKCSCSMIVDALPLAQSTVSKHLLELKKARLVSLKTQGKKAIYSLSENNMAFIKDLLPGFTGKEKNAASAKASGKVNKKLQQQNYVFAHRQKKANQ